MTLAPFSPSCLIQRKKECAFVRWLSKNKSPRARVFVANFRKIGQTGNRAEFHYTTIPINYGIIHSHSLPITGGEPETSGTDLRRLSISFSHEIIWFQVGMLWDAKPINKLHRRCESFGTVTPGNEAPHKPHPNGKLHLP